MSTAEKNQDMIAEAKEARFKSVSNMQKLRLNQDSALGEDFAGTAGARR